jgi:hypothetical protein
VKKVPQARYPKCSKKAKEADVSLEAHASTVSPDDVSNSSLLAFLSCTSTLTHFFSQALVRRFIALGTDERPYRAPCVVLVINDNPYGLMVALSYMCRTCP